MTVNTITNVLSEQQDTATPGRYDIPAYEDNPDFNAYLDEEPVFIYKLKFAPSRILYTFEPVSYTLYLQEWKQQRVESLKEDILHYYPTPIAYHLYRFEMGWQNVNQRRDILRDLWESVIYTLYALVVGEFRYARISLCGLIIDPSRNIPLKMDDFFSERLSDKLRPKFPTNVGRCSASGTIRDKLDPST